MRNDALKRILLESGVPTDVAEACSCAPKSKVQERSEPGQEMTGASGKELVKSLSDESLERIVEVLTTALAKELPDLESDPRLAVDAMKQLGRKLAVSRSIEAKMARRLKARGMKAQAMKARRTLAQGQY